VRRSEIYTIDADGQWTSLLGTRAESYVPFSPKVRFDIRRFEESR